MCPSLVTMFSRKPPRSIKSTSGLIFDTRYLNTFIKSPVSTYSYNVSQPLKEILTKYTYLSMIDISNAYNEIKLDRPALDSNISQVYKENRCVRLYSP